MKTDEFINNLLYIIGSSGPVTLEDITKKLKEHGIKEVEIDETLIDMCTEYLFNHGFLGRKEGPESK